MYLFRSLLPPNEDDKHLPEELSAEQEKLWRVSQLADDERTAFEWFRLGYTAHWTAETMLLDRKTARKLFSGIYRKLGVSDPAELSRIYRTVRLKPEDMPLEE
jgi:DNA-binding CsgD family transcriptional regulator